MKTKTPFLHLTAVLILFAPMLLCAQDWEDPNIKVSNSYVHTIELNNDVVDEDASNIAITKQFGNDNTIDITQHNTGEISQYSSITQRGDENQFYLIQEGYENSISAEQNGFSNSMDIGVYGYGNDFEYTQDGNLNSIKHRTYLNNGSGAIRQTGNDNGINLDERGTNLLNGITIEQTGGMKINITTSLAPK
jgi:hypothetical protein